jgi:AcrR family transcriptional regulator
MAVTQLTDGVTRTPVDSPPARVLVATIVCIGRWGLAKTTLDDIAREAGMSRATVYRLFPGGKDTVVRAAVAAEVDAVRRELEARTAGCDDVEDALVEMVTYATDVLRNHPALKYLLTHEPVQVLPHLAFGQLDVLLAAATAVAAPLLAPFVAAGDAPRAAEWVARLVLSYTIAPSAWFDLANEDDARRLVTTFVLPGLLSRKAPTDG